MSPANSYSLNSYFNVRRARAMGLALTISGLGTVLMPLTVSYLLQIYTPDQTMLIVAALMLHCVPASLLLQPVRWHMRPVPDQQIPLKPAPVVQPHKRTRTLTVTSVDVGHSLFTVTDGHQNENRVHRGLARSVSLQTRQEFSQNKMIFSKILKIVSGTNFSTM
jgi:MFS family permease